MMRHAWGKTPLGQQFARALYVLAITCLSLLGVLLVAEALWGVVLAKDYVSALFAWAFVFALLRGLILHFTRRSRKDL